MAFIWRNANVHLVQRMIGNPALLHLSSHHCVMEVKWVQLLAEVDALMCARVWLIAMGWGAGSEERRKGLRDSSSGGVVLCCD